MKLDNKIGFIKFMAFLGYFLWIITYLIRPIALILSNSINLIIGILPNFGVALSFPYLIAFICEQSKYRLHIDKIFYFSIVFGFILLVIIEILHQMFMNSPFDLNDLIASVFAFIIAGMTYWFLIKN
ncbi:hypothetical protein [Methanobacterium sp. ACI-7]|uniref:hypothetical protein n=1 Tax=unclassified Methanobacterium TaxID=2627676 RepID=UPI0039C1F421